MNRTRTFYNEMKAKMITYKIDNMDIYEHILPARQWTQNLWSGICQKAVDYFRREKIKWHNEKDNLLSSQILCVNTFFPFRNYLSLLDGFLREFYPSLTKVTDIDFEYIGEKNYLNERGGRVTTEPALMYQLSGRIPKARKTSYLLSLNSQNRALASVVRAGIETESDATMES